MIEFRKFKVGDKVNCPIWGNGTVHQIRADGLVVKFSKGLVSTFGDEELRPGHVEGKTKVKK